MGYGKEITRLIVECWAKGLTAKETITYIEQKTGKSPSEVTVYRHRQTITAKEIIEEMERQQRRDITLSQSDSVRLKYREKMLQRLNPATITQKIEAEVKIPELDGFTAEAVTAITKNLLADQERKLRPTDRKTS